MVRLRTKSQLLGFSNDERRKAGEGRRWGWMEGSCQQSHHPTLCHPAPRHYTSLHLPEEPR